MELSQNEIKVFLLLERLKYREQLKKTEKDISRLAFSNFIISWNIRKNPDIPNIDLLQEQKKKNKIKMSFLIRNKNVYKK